MSAFFVSENQGSGMLELLILMVQKMSRNASGEDVCDFLYDIGEDLAQHHPLGHPERLGALHLEMNDRLKSLGLGVCELTDCEQSLRIVHRKGPVCEDPDFAADWQRFFAALLCGLYNMWFYQSGAPAALGCRVESQNDVTTVLSFKKR